MAKTLAQLEKAIGGRPKSDETKTRVSVYLPESEITQLKDIAVKESLPLSQIVRLIIQDHFKKPDEASLLTPRHLQ